MSRKLACYALDDSQVANGINIAISYTTGVSLFISTGATEPPDLQNRKGERIQPSSEATIVRIWDIPQ